jgi:glyoxylase-like metal-dependent hydrolase (beta-lactamase superfamily II)
MSREFSIDGLEVTCFDDGILKSSVDYVIGMDRPRAIEISRAADNGEISIPVNNFLFRRGAAVVLIDAGAADTMQPTLGKLPENLRSGSVEPASITHILLTHLHPDHANGLIDAQHAAVFPNAEIVMHEVEYAFWMSAETATDPASVARGKMRNRLNLAPYLDRIKLVRSGADILGCSPLLAPGHSPGHTCWHIGTNGKDIIAWGDLVHFANIQIGYPHIGVSYDLDRELARETRLKMLDMIVANQFVVAGAHVPTPGFGRLERWRESYRLNADV